MPGLTRRTGSHSVRVLVSLEDVEQLHVRLGSLDRDDISIETDDVREDRVEVRVAEVRVGLRRVLDTGSRQTERVDSPGKVTIPVDLAERETLTDSRLIDLNGEDAGLLKVDDLVAESEGELTRLNLPRDIGTWERPVEDGDGSSEHTLDWLLRQRLGVRRPTDGHGCGTRDVRNDDGGTNVTGAIRLNPGVLSELESSEALSEVLNHVVTLGLSMNEQVEADTFLEVNGVLDLLLDELVVLLGRKLTLGELGTGKTDLLGLRERSDGGGRERR